MRSFLAILGACLVAGPAAFCAAPVTAKVSVPVQTASAEQHYRLHIEGLQLPPHSGGIVRVYVNLPEGAEPSDEHYVGYFAVVPKNSREAAEGPRQRSVGIDLSSKKALLAGQREITITLVPTSGEAAAKPTYNKMYISAR